MVLCLVFLLLLGVPLAQADMVCDGVDDDLTAGSPISNFLTQATGSMVLTYVPTGTALTGTGSVCYRGENLISDGSGNFLGLFRNNNFGGTLDRFCAYNWDGSDDAIPVAYTANVRTHLAWVHSAGTLFLYKDGALVSSVASGNTENLTLSLRLCSPGAGLSIAAQGRFIEAKTYAVALTAAQIAAEGTSAVRNVIPVAATARWNFDDCAVGANGNGVTFADRSGNGRPITGNWGANVSGLACVGSSIPYPWGVW